MEYTFLAKGNRKVIWPLYWDNVKFALEGLRVHRVD